MAFLALLCALVLLCQIQGSRAVTPVFVQTGGDVNLDVNEHNVPLKYRLISWKFKTGDVLVTFSPSSEPDVENGYTGRIEVGRKSYSVTLKNLQKRDSGTYTATVIAAKQQTLSEYNVTVQDPVSPVVLTSDSVSITSSSCNVSAICTASDSSISSSFRCDAKSCYQEGGGRSEVTRSGNSLHIYLSDESITCNHSNQVSSMTNETSIRYFCPKISETRANNLPVLIVIVLPVIIVAAIIVVVLWRRRKGQLEITQTTVYDVAMIPNQQMNETQADSAEVDSPSTTYSLVGPSNTKSDLPTSLYAAIQNTSD